MHAALLAPLAILVTAPATVQSPYNDLGKLVGDWEGKGTMHGDTGAVEFNSTVKSKWVLQSTWVEADWDVDIPELGQIEAKALMGYDEEDEKIHAILMSSMDGTPLYLVGESKESRMIFLGNTSEGETLVRATFDISKEGQFTFLFEEDNGGGWQTQFDVVFTKKK